MTGKQRQTTMTALRETGVFITCGNSPLNLMTTHNGGLGTFWNKEIFILPVRYSKLSHEIIDATKSFTISIPYIDLSREIMACDHIDGAKHNKFVELNLNPVKAKHLDTYVVGDCGLYLECKVLFSGNMTASHIDETLLAEMYSTKDLHTMYFAEVLDCYE